MLKGYQELKEQTAKKNLLYRPVFYRITNPEEKEKFNDLLAQGNIYVYDEIKDQLRELIKSRNPMRKLQDDDYAQLIEQHLNGCPITDYGVWVFYPWSDRAVHILDEAEYIELRTSANKNKISIAERNKLATKKVGVIGLSVGQSVSVTLAMERICGELRLADFDSLELNNLNRIRTGVHNLGLMKVYSVAREIAEIDPYLKTVCYPEGITDENINAFYTDGGKLDAVIDECDGVNVKILCRIKAKELNIPVLMEASDKGTLDVERFDLEPDRPIMHGWLQHLNLDLNVLKNLKTNEEKLPYMLPIAGFETLSLRMKASLLEMGVSLTTWPQLATAVTLGGAITADTCRRMFLDQYTDSGRYFIDMEQLVPDKRPKEVFTPAVTDKPLTEDKMAADAATALTTLGWSANILNHEEITQLVQAAAQAYSAGNTQPWKWHYSGDHLFLFLDKPEHESFSDINNMTPAQALGAALENLALATSKTGYHMKTTLYPLKGAPSLAAAISFHNTKTDEDMYLPELHSKYIVREHAVQESEHITDISVIAKAMTAAVSSVNGAGLIIKAAADDIKAAGNIISATERLKFFIPASHHEFYTHQLRWPDKVQYEDGIGIETMGLSAAEMMSLRVVMNPEIAQLLADWRGGQALEMTSRKRMATTNAVGLITMREGSDMGYLQSGRAIQRVMLAAAALGCIITPTLTPLLQFAHLSGNTGTKMPEHVAQEIKELHRQFNTLFPDAANMEKVFLFTIGTGIPAAGKLPAKPIEKILSFGAGK